MNLGYKCAIKEFGNPMSEVVFLLEIALTFDIPFDSSGILMKELKKWRLLKHLKD